MTNPRWYKLQSLRRLLQFRLETMLAVMFVVALAVNIYRVYYHDRPELTKRRLSDRFIIGYEVDEQEGGDATIDGQFIASDEHGRVFCRGTLDQGEPVGRWTFYYPTGRKSLSGRCRNGARCDVWTAWYANGRKRSRVEHGEPTESFSGKTFTENFLGDTKIVATRDGRAQAWWPNGERKSDGQFKEDRRDGEWTFWDRDGVKIAEGKYVNGRRHGLWSVRDEKVGRLREVFFANGERIDDVASLISKLEKQIETAKIPSIDRHFEALGKLGRASVPALLRILRTGDRLQCIRALEQLAAIGPGAIDALNQIRQFTKGEDSHLRASALAAIYAINPAKQNSTFRQLNFEARSLRGNSQIQVISVMASLGPSVLPHVEQLLKSNDAKNQLVALNVLNTMIVAGRYDELAKSESGFHNQFLKLLQTTTNKHPNEQTANLARFVLENLENWLQQDENKFRYTTYVFPVVG